MSAPNQLLLDLTSPLPTLDEAQVRAWARTQTVMISSTMRDLHEEREVVASAVSSIGATPRYFERFSSPADPAQVYHPEVGRASIYLFLAGERYGDPVPNDTQGRSATHLEYDTAYTSYKPVLAYNKTGTGREHSLATFITQLEQRHTVTRFSTTGELTRAVLAGLRGIAEAQSTTWVKLGQAVFPVERVALTTAVNGGNTLDPRQQHQNTVLTANLHNAQILAALQNNAYARPLTLAGQIFDTSAVRVHQEASGRFAVQQRIEIELRSAAAQTLTVIPIANGESAEEQLKVALESLLFNRALPATHRQGGHSFLRALPHIGPDLARLHQQLATNHREAELFVPMAELLLTDALLRGTQRVPAPLTSLEFLEVSPVIQEQMYVRVVGVHEGGHFGAAQRIECAGQINLRPSTPSGITGW